jgi:hypothetical protein
VRYVLRYLGPALLFVFLTALTQVGGFAYLIGLAIPSAMPTLRSSPLIRRMSVVVIALTSYALMTAFVVPPLAASMGRVPLPCSTAGNGSAVAATWLTCALNRGYVRPEVLDLVMALSTATAQRFPGSKITTLEGNLPFLDGFPLLPHLSHRDGKKVDIAFFYRSIADSAVVPSGSPSWLGYFIYEQPRASEATPCGNRWTPLRWDFDRLQPQPPVWRLDEERTAWTLNWLKDDPRVDRIFIEPHLAQRAVRCVFKVA